MAVNESNPRASLFAAIQRYIKLLIENTRLNAAEKLTQFLSAFAVCAIALILALMALVFISIGICSWLAPILGMGGAALVVAGFYILLICILLIFKQRLIIDPIARFISILLLDNPTSTTNVNPGSNDQPTNISQ